MIFGIVIAVRFPERILVHKEDYVQSPIIGFEGTESSVRLDTLDRPRGKFHCGPIAAALACWKDSKQRLVADEFCRFPRRIVAM